MAHDTRLNVPSSKEALQLLGPLPPQVSSTGVLTQYLSSSGLDPIAHLRAAAYEGGAGGGGGGMGDGVIVEREALM